MSKEISQNENKNDMKNQKDNNIKNVIEIKDLCKKYKMYHSKKDRLLEIVLPKYEKHTTFTALENFNLELLSEEDIEDYYLMEDYENERNKENE